MEDERKVSTEIYFITNEIKKVTAKGKTSFEVLQNLLPATIEHFSKNGISITRTEKGHLVTIN